MAGKKAQFMESSLGKIVLALAILIVLLIMVWGLREKIWDKMAALGRMLRFG